MSNNQQIEDECEKITCETLCDYLDNLNDSLDDYLDGLITIKGHKIKAEKIKSQKEEKLSQLKAYRLCMIG